MPVGDRKERKVVTVLFADLVGFTSQAEALDPEDVEAILAPYHEHLRSELETYGGTVEKFVGDAVMALFGAPTAHEDDPERAVRAALSIRDWANDERIQLRIGVTTGEALVKLEADPRKGEGMATGDVVNTASRLQANAPANGILIDESTYRATRTVIDYEDAPAVVAKGKSKPVPVWQALQAKARLGVDVARYHVAPLAGREREVALLRGALERVLHERSAHLLTIVGAPGIGKSRLVHELTRTIRTRSEVVVWRQGRSLPYGEGVSFSSLTEMVKAQTGVLDGDSEKTVEAKLAQAVTDLVEDEPAWVLRHLLRLVGLGGDREAERVDQSEQFAAWRRFFEGMATQDAGAAVLVFEDLHWADEGLLDFIAHLAEWTRRVPLLLIGTARPELLERRPTWGDGKLNATTLALQPLSDEEMGRLAQSLLGESELGADIRAGVLEKAAGNPLYGEQYVRMFLERGVDDRSVPENVQGIIAARLDNLNSEEKALLQEASAFGKVFWPAAFAVRRRHSPEQVEELLHLLEHKDFVQRARRSSVAGSSEYAFRHVLVRDVAYSQIPRANRSLIHQRVADWFESLGRPEDHAEVVAHHYMSALRFARASGLELRDLQDRARNALVAAGDRAAGLNAFAQAARFYKDAVAEWPRTDDRRPDLLFRLGRALRLSEESGTDVLAEALEGLLALGLLERAAEAESLLADLSHLRGDWDDAKAHLAAAAELVAPLPDSATKASVLAQLARFQMLVLQNERSLELCADALAIADRLGLDQVRTTALNTRGCARVALGDFDGYADVEASLELALEISSVWDICRGYTNLAVVAQDVFGNERSLELDLEGIEAAQKLGVPALSRWSRGNAAIGLFNAGRWDEALEVANAFIADTGAPSQQEWICRTVRYEIQLERNESYELSRDFTRMVAFAHEPGSPWNTGRHGVLAYFLLETGKPAEAAEALDVMIADADDVPQLFWCTINGAFAAHILGREDEQLEAIERSGIRPETIWGLDICIPLLNSDLLTAADAASRRGLLSAEARLRFAAAEQLVEEGSVVEAEEQLQQALSFYRRVGAKRRIDQAESLVAKTT